MHEQVPNCLARIGQEGRKEEAAGAGDWSWNKGWRHKLRAGQGAGRGRTSDRDRTGAGRGPETKKRTCLQEKGRGLRTHPEKTGKTAFGREKTAFRTGSTYPKTKKDAPPKKRT